MLCFGSYECPSFWLLHPPQAMKDLGLGTTFEDAENLFSMVDEDGSGTMEEEEFVQHCMDAIVAMQEEDDNEPTPALMRQPTALGVTMSSSFRQQVFFWQA